MFGLENKKKQPHEEFLFDIEVELQDSAKLKEVKTLIESRIASIKNHLRSGENKEEFVNYGVLLHGYASLLKVINKAVAGQKK
jgi:hypothetical protein